MQGGIFNFCVDGGVSGEGRKIFGSRIWFIGLQGSYGRNEASEQSDIDVVLILDQVSAEDLHTYGKVLDSLPAREKSAVLFQEKRNC